MAFALCPPAEVPRRRISAIAAFLSVSRFTPNSSFLERASLATPTRESISNFMFSSEAGPVAGSYSRAPMQRCPRKHSISTGFPEVLPVRVSHRSNKARPYVSGRESASMPGRPLNVSLFRFPNEYILPCCTGIIMGDGSIPLSAKFLSYSNLATLYDSSHRNVPMSIPNSFTFATSTIRIPPC